MCTITVTVRAHSRERTGIFKRVMITPRGVYDEGGWAGGEGGGGRNNNDAMFSRLRGAAPSAAPQYYRIIFCTPAPPSPPPSSWQPYARAGGLPRALDTSVLAHTRALRRRRRRRTTRNPPRKSVFFPDDRFFLLLLLLSSSSSVVVIRRRCVHYPCFVIARASTKTTKIDRTVGVAEYGIFDRPDNITDTNPLVVTSALYN